MGEHRLTEEQIPFADRLATVINAVAEHEHLRMKSAECDVCKANREHLVEHVAKAVREAVDQELEAAAQISESHIREGQVISGMVPFFIANSIRCRISDKLLSDSSNPVPTGGEDTV